MHRHLCIVIGRLKFENWHLYWDTYTRAVKKPEVRWKVWRKVI